MLLHQYKNYFLNTVQSIAETGNPLSVAVFGNNAYLMALPKMATTINSEKRPSPFVPKWGKIYSSSKMDSKFEFYTFELTYIQIFMNFEIIEHCF